MVFHLRCVPDRNERQENHGLKGDSVVLCPRGGLWVCPQSPTSVMNGKTYEFIKMDKISLALVSFFKTKKKGL